MNAAFGRFLTVMMSCVRDTREIGTIAEQCIQEECYSRSH
jgi:hypothetical protein